MASTEEQTYDDLLKEMRVEYPAQAISYCESTWLHLQKEKLVTYWVNQHYHFGATVTSPIEGCHATLKSYLQRGNGDLRGVFLRIQHFWDTQHETFKTTTAQQKLRPKISINTPLFAAVLQYVHGFALDKILLEYAKLPTTGPPPHSCNCTIQQSHGLPCYHTIWERKCNGGVILLGDIHRHWYYNRISNALEPSVTLSTLRPVLNPVRIQGKGRPRGALGGVTRIAESSTRRYPSSWELPSSSAPPALDRPKSPTQQLWIVHSGLKQPSSTALAMARLVEGHIDQYEPGTRRERGYMCGMSSIYKDDSMVDATALAANAMSRSMIAERRDVVGGVEVYTQDAEFDLDDDFE